MKTITTIVLCLLMFSACKKKDIVTKAIQTSTEGSITFWTKGVSQTFTYTDSTPVYDRYHIWFNAKYYPDKNKGRYFSLFFSSLKVDSLNCPAIYSKQTTTCSFQLVYQPMMNDCVFSGSSYYKESSLVVTKSNSTRFSGKVINIPLSYSPGCTETLPGFTVDSAFFDLPFVKR